LFSACLQGRTGWLFGTWAYARVDGSFSAWRQEPFCNETPVVRKTMIEPRGDESGAGLLE